MEPVIETQGLTHVYIDADNNQVTALDGIGMQVQPGEFVAVIGARLKPFQFEIAQNVHDGLHVIGVILALHALIQRFAAECVLWVARTFAAASKTFLCPVFEGICARFNPFPNGGGGIVAEPVEHFIHLGGVNLCKTRFSH